VEKFIDKLNQYDSSISNSHFERDLGPLPRSDKECCDFLNRLLSQVQRAYYVFETGARTQHFLRFAAEKPIKTIASCSIAPKGHCKATTCRPSLVETQQSRLRPSPRSNKVKGQGGRDTSDTTLPHTLSHTHISSTDTPIPASAIEDLPLDWIELETVVAYHSEGTSIRDNTMQAVAYTGYLLASRPDRVAALGLSIEPNGFVVILVDPTWVLRTELIKWTSVLAKGLLFRVLSYIGSPPSSMVDPTIRRENDGTFQTTANGSVHKNYRQFWAPTLGRWTTILKAKDPRTGTGSVFKYQYLRAGSEISEGRIHERIHDPEEIPGVVRAEWYGWVEGSGWQRRGVRHGERSPPKGLSRVEELWRPIHGD
jgi:hypothetical protein